MRKKERKHRDGGQRAAVATAAEASGLPTSRTGSATASMAREDYEAQFKPSDRERRGWYFQRYVAHLPVAEEFVLFNRSRYNRAGVEHVMGLRSKNEQTRRLAQRKRDPLKQCKSSPVNAAAVKLVGHIPRRATRCCCERTPPSRHGTSCGPTTSVSRV